MKVEPIHTSGMTPQLMRAVDKLADSLNDALENALEDGISPAMIIGNLEVAKMAVYRYTTEGEQ